MASLTRPMNVQIEITDKCNFRCRHCYHLDFAQHCETQDIPDAQIMSLAEKIVAAGIFAVVLTGGEPLMRKELTKRLVKYFKQNNIDVSLNTNLVLLDAKTLQDLIANHLDGMLISCPSSNPELYAFMTGASNYARFEANLKMLIKHEQHCSVNMVVNRHNFGSIRSTASRLHSLGVKIFGATPMGLNLQNPDLENLLGQDQVRTLIDDLMWIKDQFKMQVDIFESIPRCIFPESVRNNGASMAARKCQAGKTIVSIANNGDIRPCSHNPQIYGNLLQEPLETIWGRMSEWRDFREMPERCQQCKLLHDCYGGCRITAKAITQNPKGEDPWMLGPITCDTTTKIQNKQYSLHPQMKVTSGKIFRWRQEKGDDFLISSTRSGKNTIIVTEEMCRFVRTLRERTPCTLGELTEEIGIDFNDQEFQRVIKLLATREFISLVSNRKEEPS